MATADVQYSPETSMILDHSEILNSLKYFYSMEDGEGDTQEETDCRFWSTNTLSGVVPNFQE